MASVIALGLDAADPVLLETWMAAGHLPHLAALQQRGSYARLETFEYCRAEASNTTFLTGCSPDSHGYWSPFRYDPASYTVQQVPYSFSDFPPFYGLGPDYRVCVFDMPQSKLVDDLNGIQLLGWGAHSPRCPSHSSPPELYDEIVAKHGAHPAYKRDDVHSMGDRAAMMRLKNWLLEGIRRRVAICRELLQRQPWDLFLTYFSELHSGQHYFWHLSQPGHPLHDAFATPGEDPLLEIFQAVDRAVGDIVALAPADAIVTVFSDHGMEPNVTDVPSMVLLPELLYRTSFPGRYGLAKGRPGTAPPPVITPMPTRSWRSTLYGLKVDRNPITRWLRQRMDTAWFHFAIERRLGLTGVPLCPENCPLGAQPPMWYSPAWPEMTAFALPSFSEGYVRLNVRTRDAKGVVEPADYSRTVERVIADLQQLRNARTGEPALRDVVRTRRDAFTAAQPGSHPADADIIVIWSDTPMDVVDHPTAGRIGPVPFKRSGSHVHRGFMLTAGAGIPAGVVRERRHSLDLAPTILRLMGAPVPAHFEGAPLFDAATSEPTFVSRAS